MSARDGESPQTNRNDHRIAFVGEEGGVSSLRLGATGIGGSDKVVLLLAWLRCELSEGYAGMNKPLMPLCLTYMPWPSLCIATRVGRHGI